VGGIVDIACAVNLDGRIEVFAIGTDRALNHIWQTSPGGAWSSWEGLGGTNSNLSVSSNLDGRLEVFTVGAANSLYHIWQTTVGSAVLTPVFPISAS
jgi:hypothetical protein